MSKKALVQTFVALICASFSAPLASERLFVEPVDASSEVRKLHLNFLSIGQEINKQSCNRSFTNLFACVQGLHKALASVDPQLAIVPTASLSSRQVRGNFVSQLGDVAIIRRPKIRFENPQQLQLWVKEEMTKSQKQWAAFGNSQLPAQKILLWIKNNLPKKFTSEDLSTLAFESIQETLRSGSDPHQYLRPASLFRERRSSLGKSYAGIGIDIRTYKGITRIAKVHHGSPSQKMKLQEGEELLAINLEPLKTMSDEEIREKLRDVIGSSVRLKLRFKNKTREVTLRRSEIILPSVTSEIKRVDSKRYGYLKIADFEAENTGERARAALVNFDNRRVKSVVLDLRNNGGGRMTEAVEVVGAFLKSGLPVLTIKSFGRSFDEIKSAETILSRGGPVADGPLIILINASSGSAAEIVAGALEYHKRAVVMGERSFGKGTYQSAENKVFGGKLLKFKTKGVFYIADSQYSCQVHGILPHIEIPKSPETVEATSASSREENLFNALRVESAPLVPIKTAWIQSLESCIRGRQPEALSRYKQINESGLIADYQLINTEEAFRCNL